MRKRTWLVLVVAAVVIILGGCGAQENAESPEPARLPPATTEELGQMVATLPVSPSSASSSTGSGVPAREEVSTVQQGDLLNNLSATQPVVAVVDGFLVVGFNGDNVAAVDEDGEPVSVSRSQVVRLYVDLTLSSANVTPSYSEKSNSLYGVVTSPKMVKGEAFTISILVKNGEGTKNFFIVSTSNTKLVGVRWDPGHRRFVVL